MAELAVLKLEHNVGPESRLCFPKQVGVETPRGMKLFTQLHGEINVTAVWRGVWEPVTNVASTHEVPADICCDCHRMCHLVQCFGVLHAARFRTALLGLTTPQLRKGWTSEVAASLETAPSAWPSVFVRDMVMMGGATSPSTSACCLRSSTTWVMP